MRTLTSRSRGTQIIAGAGGTFADLQAHMWYLVVRRLLQGYYKDMTKSILVVSLRNVLREEA